MKLMAQARGIRIHQYLDDWLLRAQSQETCLQDTQTLLALCQKLGWVVNMRKSELDPQQIFNFVGYWFDLVSGRVLPTQDRWIALQEKLNFIKNQSNCTVRQFMSLIGLLTATEKQVLSGRLHMRPIQWHLKHHWHVPELLEKVIPVPPSSTPRLVVRRKQCSGGPTFAPSSTRSSAVYIHLKRRLGHTLRGLHCKRCLVSHRKSPSHKLLGTESSPPGPEGIRASLQGPDCSCCDG